MATLLYRIGCLAFRRRGLTVLLWLLVLGGAGAAASSAPPPPADTFSMPGTESQETVDLLKEKFPAANADGASARVVVRAPEGEKISDPGPRRRVTALVAELSEGPQVVAASDPFAPDAVSEDGRTAYTIVTYEVTAMEVSDEAHDALTGAADEARADGLRVEMGGDAVPVEQAAGGTAEGIGIGIAALILLATFGSLVAAGMPLLTAVVGVGVGISAIGALGSALDLSATANTLALMIGLAVGIDYALFIVSRYRSEMAEGREKAEAVGRAVGTAGSAVVFAGLTVIVALAGLAVVDVPMLTKMGLAAAGTVAIAVLVAITFVPALLGFAPFRVLRRSDRRRIAGRPLSERQQRRAAKQAARQRPGPAVRWAGFVLRRPVLVLLFGVLSLGVVAVPATRLELGLPSEGTMAPDTTQRKAYDMLSGSFGPGFNGPLLVTVEADDARSVGKDIAAALADEPGVARVGPVVPNESGDTATIGVVPDRGPADDRTRQLVESLRGDLPGVGRAHDAEVLVGGQTAMFIDFSQVLDDALLPYLAVVVGLAFLLLTMVFRSLLVPLKAALGFLLSVSAALGAIVAIFQWGWLADVVGVDQPGPIMSTMPIMMIGVVFGLAMDYEVFLVTRIREAHVHGESTGEAVVTGFRHGGRVVSAAALIMTSVFSGFIMEDNVFVRMIGLGLALAVLFDAFVVRMAVVPALFAVLGDRAWWLPKWLGRVLPDMDVEGGKLARPGAPARDPRAEHEPEYSG
ncbi:MMPL family transporter [Streptomyces sp. 8P21H-1]|uniref:MMPL family transporter n=1 Tax=Streptomyces sp. 8P21H-1 TaxID=2737048 RepID=UPI0015713A60|nr:MMPL family transporter [Streptomyces sp. 8P21H-1]NSL43791.1 MMPL family transporter [Streptomyces sp. 8P21H-1]